MKNKNIIRLAVAIVMTIVFIELGYFLQKASKQPILLKTEESSIGGSFTMTDQNGKIVTDKDYADRIKLFNFGFTSCPSICPTELQKMASVLNLLGQDSDKIYTIFVTVDPQRDTVEIMKDYVSLFHSQLIGLVGTKEQTNAIKKAWNVYSNNVPMGNEGEYTVDHSTYTYLMDKNNHLIARFKMQDRAKDIVKVIQNLL